MSSPNWRDSAHYPAPGDTSLHRWAWEFLRRNPIFEAEVAAAAKQQRADGDSRPPYSKGTPLRATLDRWGVRYPMPANWRGRPGDHPGDAPVRFDLAPRFVRTSGRGDETELAYSLLRADRLLLEFDLDAPLEPQIERAQRILASNQRLHFPRLKRLRNQVEKFPRYLRLLDALAADATKAEMLDVFALDAPTIDERTLRYWTKRAMALRDGGYLALLKQ